MGCVGGDRMFSLAPIQFSVMCTFYRGFFCAAQKQPACWSPTFSLPTLEFLVTPQWTLQYEYFLN